MPPTASVAGCNTGGSAVMGAYEILVCLLWRHTADVLHPPWHLSTCHFHVKQGTWLDEVRKISKYILQIKVNPTQNNFSYVRNKTVTTSNIGPLRLEDCKVEMTEALTDYFATVFTI